MKTILITGCSKGIGFDLSHALLKSGYRVIGLSRSIPMGLKAFNEFHHMKIDLKNSNDVQECSKQIAKQHSIYCLIANAGFGRFQLLESLSSNDIQDMMQVNYTSHAILTKAILPDMKSKKEGKIIFIGSEASLKGAKLATAYSASKFALKGFAESLRCECNSNNISVTSILPGMTDTSFYESLHFKPGDAPENAINTDTIVDLVQFILSQPSYSVLDTIEITPMKKVIQKK